VDGFASLSSLGKFVVLYTLFFLGFLLIYAALHGAGRSR
jgi:hypothetical protein